MTDAEKERERVLAILSAHDLANSTFAHQFGPAHPEGRRCRDACDLIRQLEDDIRAGTPADVVRERVLARLGPAGPKGRGGAETAATGPKV